MAVTMRKSRRHPQSQLAALLTACLFGFAALQPGVLIGAALTFAWLRWVTASRVLRVVAVTTATVVFALSLSAVAWAWPWKLLFAAEPSRLLPVAWPLQHPLPTVALSLLAEAFAGPAWATGLLLIRWTRDGMPSDMIAKERQRLEERRRKLDPTRAPKPIPEQEGHHSAPWGGSRARKRRNPAAR